MKYALVVVEKPISGGGVAPRDWTSFLSHTENTKHKSKKTLKCSENTWLLSLESDTALLAQILAPAQTYGFVHRVFYFSHDPIEYTYDPNL